MPARSAVAAVAALTVTGVISAAPAQASSPGWYRTSESISCSTATGSHRFYDGADASARYDALFAKGPAIPRGFLNTWTPQGLGALPNGTAKHRNVLLVSGYHSGASHSALIGLVIGGGATHTVAIPKSHAGGVAVVGSWAFITGADSSSGYPTINRYRASDVRARLAGGGTLHPVHTAVIGVGGTGFVASFLGVYGSTLFVGMFDASHRNRMYRYTVAANGDLHRVGSASDWTQVPMKTQGLAVTATHFVFSTSYGRTKRGNLYVERRGHKYLDDAYPQDLTCFRSPSMNEGLAVVGSSAYLSFESGSYEYRGDPKTLNVIPGTHVASVAALERLT